jgi:hypothetical protein
MLRALQPTWESILVFGAGAALLGLAGLLAGSPKQWSARVRIISCLLALGAVVASAGAAVLGAPQYAWLPVVTLVTVGGFLELLAYQGVRSGTLFLLGPALVLGSVGGFVTDMPAMDPSQLIGPLPPDFFVSEEPAAWAITDAGYPVPLHSVRLVEGEAPFDAARETEYLRHHDLLLTVIRTGDAGLRTNCHGWIFTGGRYWVSPQDVDRILRENGYRPTTEPQAGDVAVYRDDAGRAMHTAVVRGAGDDGTVLQESKWGALGRFVHTDTRHPYSPYACTYYRSSRGDHILKRIGTPAMGAEPGPAEERPAGPVLGGG